MRFLRLALLAAALGCESPSTPMPSDGAAPDAAPDLAGPPVRTLGLNDVSVLVPLPAEATAPVLLRAADQGDDGTALVPRALFDMLNDIPNRPMTVPDVYGDLQVMALRFDLCDRIVPGACPDSDGRLRIVFQPVASSGAQDVAFHAFYTIPVADLPSVVAELRALSALQGSPTSAPLAVSPALTRDPRGEYAARLRKLIRKYGGTRRLQRLTFFAQPLMFAAVRWVFRGVERKGSAFQLMVIPGIKGDLQEVLLMGNKSFDVTPVVDAPKGFVLALSGAAFTAASLSDRGEALRALASTDNPLVSTPDTVQCATCHTSTLLLKERAAVAGVDPQSVGGRYPSTYDLSVAGGQAPTTERTLRALGWLQRTPLISQRAVNESAQAALEMDTRFPP